MERHRPAIESAPSADVFEQAVSDLLAEAVQLQRGDTLVEPATIAAVDTIDAEVTLLRSAPSLKHRASVHFYAFASECMARLFLLGCRVLESGSVQLVRLQLSKSIVLLPGDRFVLRHGSPITTIGGGRVLESV